MRVLLIEDDPMIGKSLSIALGREGLVVDWVREGDEGADAWVTGDHALVLLDLGLPNRSGLSILKWARANKNTAAVLIITARDGVDDRVAGLDLGADDYVVKPFEVRELVARIRAVLRRRAGAAQSLLSAGEITLDIASHEMSYRQTTSILPAREFALMHAFVERPGMILSRRQIEEKIYGWGEEVESNAVDVLIHSIRKKFDKDIVRNVRGGLADPEGPELNSIRRTALLWMTGLLAIAGLCAFVVAYELARKEAADFLDGQLRQIALNAGEGVADADAPDAVDKQDPEDEFVIAIWSSTGKVLRQSPIGTELPRQAAIGFSTVSFGGEDWRVYLASDCDGQFRSPSASRFGRNWRRPRRCRRARRFSSSSPCSGS